MAEHAYSVLCEMLLRDEETNVASMIGVIEKITIPRKLEDVEHELEGSTGILFPMRLVTWLARSDYSKPETVDHRAGWLCPDGEYVGVGEHPISLEEMTSIRVQLMIPGVPWHGPGLYWLLIEKRDTGKEWTIATRLPMELVVAAPQKSDGAES